MDRVSPSTATSQIETIEQLRERFLMCDVSHNEGIHMTLIDTLSFVNEVFAYPIIKVATMSWIESAHPDWNVKRDLTLATVKHIYGGTTKREIKRASKFSTLVKHWVKLGMNSEQALANIKESGIENLLIAARGSSLKPTRVKPIGVKVSDSLRERLKSATDGMMFKVIGRVAIDEKGRVKVMFSQVHD